MSDNYCFGCGADLPQDAEKCPVCGRDLAKLVNEQPVFEQSPPRVWREFRKAPPAANEPVKEPAREPAEPEMIEPSTGDKIIGTIFTLIGGVLSMFMGYALIKLLQNGAYRDYIVTISLLLAFFLLMTFTGISRFFPHRKRAAAVRKPKKRQSAARIAFGVVITLIGLAGVYIFTTVLTAVFREDRHGRNILILFFVMIDILCLCLAGIGIKRLFPRRLPQKPAEENEKNKGE